MKIILIMLILISSIQAAYYADLSIEVDSSGFVTIQGLTDHPSLLTVDSSEYTSKKGEYWTLNITTEEKFSEFIYKIKLPEHSTITYIKSTGIIGIENQGQNLVVKGIGENSEISAVIQYKTDRVTNNLMPIIIGSVIITFIISLFIKNKKPTIAKKQFELEKLPERQKQIMELLIERKKPLTQAQIQKELNIPKASTSRNINSLELKGLIKKENIGITNLIKLSK